MLPLVAKHADIWNCQIAASETYSQLSSQLDTLLLAAGRKPGDVQRTVMNPVIIWRDQTEYRRFLDIAQPFLFPGVTENKEKEILEIMTFMNAVIGSPAQVIETMQTYADAGVDEFIIQRFIVDDFAGLEVIAKEVLPHFLRQ
jgi:alkanesulfonate monooxygenase SsuD/methylene tetrahydromethanopterin reductase-like flavin-dependent oxidoreductase (luciferase family)